MARPRVFISSTCYDLKYIRTELERFLKDHLGYEPVLSERGDIAWKSQQSLEESCYDEVKTCQIFVLIIGGRYGSVSRFDLGEGEEFSVKKSITMNEYLAAAKNDTPTFIFVESDVYAEYRTFKENPDNEEIKWAQVNDSRIYNFIEHIESKQMNNPIHAFKEVDDIINHLKLQFAGLFKEFLTSLNEQQPISRLDGKLDELTGMFQLILKSQGGGDSSTDNTAEIVKALSTELKQRDEDRAFYSSDAINHMIDRHQVPRDAIKKIYDKASSYLDFTSALNKLLEERDIKCSRLTWGVDGDLKYHLNLRKGNEEELETPKSAAKVKKK